MNYYYIKGKDIEDFTDFMTTPNTIFLIYFCCYNIHPIVIIQLYTKTFYLYNYGVSG
jgi:hypothetical protein